MDRLLLQNAGVARRKIVSVVSGLFLIILLSGFDSTAEDETVLMVINDREISKTEFLRLWKKDNLYSEMPVDQYLDLFIDFHLKVAHAKDEGIHQNILFEEELARYRKQLVIPYLTDKEKEEQLVNEAYSRLLYDVNASHILVRLAPGFSPEDSLQAWEKTMQIRESILKGENFEVVANATSDDPSAKVNSGNLGYFTVFQMAYPFENKVYNAEPGELSMPVRTRFGYHIIRLNDRTPSRGEIKTAHIMIGFNRYDEETAAEKVMKVYNDLKAGYSFEMMAKEHSTDNNTAPQGGMLPWFGAGRLVPEFEEAAFAIENPGDISEPVRTSFGWHIIKLIDHREIPPLDEIRQNLVDMIRNSRDERSALVREALVNRLMREWNYNENLPALELFYHMVGDTIFSGNWSPPSTLPMNQVIFSVSGANVTQRAFAEFISESAYRRNPWPMEEYIYSLYRDFVSQWLIKYEDQNLENKYPEFRYLMNEYKDGMLLFEITDREVWSRAITDSTGLELFHEINNHNYMWGTRISASIFTTDDARIARRAARRAGRSIRFSSRDENWVIDRLNRGAGDDVITYEKGLYAMGDNQLADQVNWAEGVSEIIERDNTYNIILIHDVVEPQPKSIEEAREQVIADYQDYLEEQWVEDLRGKYNVTVYKDVLSDIY